MLSNQEEDDWPYQKDTHITIFVPVLILDRKSAKGWPEPVIRVGNRGFKAETRNDISTTGGPDLSEVELPRGWSMTKLEAEIPLRFVKKKFEVEISYRQQNLKNDVAGYVPIKPPQEHAASVIVFRAADGYALKPVKRRWFGKRVPAQSSLEFKPGDKQSVSVRCVRKE